MPPLMPYQMTTRKEIQDAAIFNAKQWVEILEGRDVTANSLALQATAIHVLAERLKAIETQPTFVEAVNREKT